jgi:epoxyqueuosine reductase
MAASVGAELGALAAELSSIGRRAGLDAVGIAASDPFSEVEQELRARKAAGLHAGMAFTYRNPSRSTDPSRTLPGARALVVGARAYWREEPLSPASATRVAGRIARYSWRDEYGPLRAALRQVAERLRAAGHRAVVVADDNALVDRAAAYRAGIGWWGKNSLILIRGAGSFFVLGSVITDAPLPVADRRVADGCGSCTRCLEACPTSAIVSPGVLDARRCLAWLLEAPGSFPLGMRTALGNRIYGCDDCQDVCPVNRSALRHHPPPPAVAGDEASVDLLEMLAASDDDLLERFGRFYFAGRDPAVLRRNALLALANEGDPSDRRVREAVAAAAASGSPLIAEHASWADRRLDERQRLRERERDPV